MLIGHIQVHFLLLGVLLLGSVLLLALLELFVVDAVPDVVAAVFDEYLLVPDHAEELVFLLQVYGLPDV